MGYHFYSLLTAGYKFSIFGRQMMIDLSFSKKDTLIIKGIAILLMIFHHYFSPLAADASRALDGGNLFWWAWAGKSCVCLFAFVTGYGLTVRIFAQTGPPVSFGKSLFAFHKIYLFCLLLAVLAMRLFPCPGIHVPEGWVAWALSVSMIYPGITGWWYACAFVWMMLVMGPMLALCRNSRWDWRKSVPAVLLALLPLIFVEPSLLANILHWLGKAGVSTGTLTCVRLQITDTVKFLPWFAVGAAYAGIALQTGWRRGVIAAGLAVALWAWGTVRYPHMHLILLGGAMAAIGSCYVFRRCRPLSSSLGLLGRFSVWMWLNHLFILVGGGDLWKQMCPAVAYGCIVAISLLLGIAMDATFLVVCRFLSCVPKRLGRFLGGGFRANCRRYKGS